MNFAIWDIKVKQVQVSQRKETTSHGYFQHQALTHMTFIFNQNNNNSRNSSGTKSYIDTCMTKQVNCKISWILLPNKYSRPMKSNVKNRKVIIMPEER